VGGVFFERWGCDGNPLEESAHIPGLSLVYFNKVITIDIRRSYNSI